MKRLFVSTAIVLAMGAPAIATENPRAFQTYTASQQGDVYASDFIGMRIYAVEKDFDRFDENYEYAKDADTEWSDIGEINDVVLGRNGDIKAVILGVGGFLGIGEKDIAVPMSEIRFVNESDETGDFFLVVPASRQHLTDAEPYTRTSDPRSMKKRTDSPYRAMFDRPVVDREGYADAEPSDLTAERLMGAVVYDTNDKNIGEVDQLVLTDQGKIEKIVLDVGGFLGLGEKQVAVTLDELAIVRTKEGDDFRVYIEASKAELEAQPTYAVN